jgi:peptide/nickel transport system substrate-binding protein
MAKKSYWQRVHDERISRRRLLGAAGMGAAGLAIAAACGGGDTGSDRDGLPTRVSGDPQRGGRYKWAFAVNADTFDPHISIAGALAFLPRIYNVLINQSAVRPDFIYHDLADEFEAPEPGGLEWIFHIRPGVKIAPNGLGIPERDLEAEDAKVSFERIRGLPEANACAFVCEWFDSHDAIDAQTYRVKTPKPYAWFLVSIGTLIATIPPRELILQDPERMRENAVGAGPFFLTPGGYVEGQRLTLDRNPNYYRTDPNNDDASLPYVDGWDVVHITDRSALRTAFLSQQSYQYGAENRDEAEQLLDQYEIYQGSSDPVNTFISFTMNVTRPPWDNPNVRKAAMHALNRQQYIDIVYKGDAQANGLVHWPTGAYALPEDELDDLQKFDPELSKQLIQEAGFDLPLSVKVSFPANSVIEEHSTHLPIFLEQMAAAGFAVEQDAQDFVTWLDNYTNKEYDASLALNQIYETPQIPLDFQHSKGPAGADIYANGLQDPEVDAAIEGTKEITDPEQLVEEIHRVQRLIYDKGPAFLPIVSPFSRTLYWNFVKNIPSGLGTTGLLLNDWWLEV